MYVQQDTGTDGPTVIGETYWHKETSGRRVGGTGGAAAGGLGLITWVPLHMGSQASRTSSSSGGGLAPKWVGELVSPPAPDSGVGAKWIKPGGRPVPKVRPRVSISRGHLGVLVRVPRRPCQHPTAPLAWG